MADPKPWELSYEEPKPWEVQYEKPTDTEVNEFGLPRFKPSVALAPPTQQDIEDAQAQAHPLTTPLLKVIPKIGAETVQRIMNIPAALARQRMEETPDVMGPEGEATAPNQPILEKVAQMVPSDKAVAITTGLEHAAADTANFFTSPLGISTLGIGALPKAIQSTIALAFAGQMAKEVPEIAKQLGSEWGKPEDQRDYQKISELAANAVANTAFAAAGVKHGVAKPLAEKLGAYPIEPGQPIPPPKPFLEQVKQEIKKPVTEPVTQPKETDASQISPPATLHGDVRPQPVEGQGQVPTEEGGKGVQPQTSEGQTVRPLSLTEAGPHPTADQLIEMTPNEVVDWTKRNRYGMNLDPKAGTTSIEVSEKLKPEDIPKLEAERDKLRAEFKKEYNEALKTKDPDRLGKTLPTQLKSQTLDEIIADYHEGAANVDYVQYQRLVRELKRAPLEERFAIQKQIEPIKNKYGGKIPPRDLPKTESPTSETVLASQSTTHGLPQGVPNRGPQFASELMEASRQLGALVRSRATLRPGVLGQFVKSKLAGIQQADRIEVGDIRNQGTVAHEIGHSLDGILWPQINFGESQKSLAARVGTGTGKELHQELTKVSELMRGPMRGSSGHVAYRKRATELIADFVSLYSHDPDRAKAMAPKFSKGFEDALAKDKNTQDVVQGIVSGNVIPKPPNPALPKALAGITGTQPQPTVDMPGKVPLPSMVAIAREHEVQHAAQELVKGEDRMFRSKVEGSRIVHDEAVKRVPDVSDRNDVGAFIEGMGNLKKPGDTIDRVRTRMNPAKEWMVKHFRFRMELSRQQLNQYLKGITDGEYVKFLEDYLPHIYKDVGPKLQGALRAWKNSPHAKQRVLPTLKEGAELGLTPITQDPAVLYELSEKMNWRVATNKKVLDAMRNDVKTSSGSPVVVPHGEGGDGWIHTEHPLFQRVYAKGTPKGLMLWERGADVHPDVWPALRQILEPAPSWTISKAYDSVNAFTRASRFLGSVFHDFSLAKAAVGSMARWYNPLRGLVRLFEKNPLTGERESFRTTRSLGKEMRQNEQIVTEAALDGLEFSSRPSQAFEQDAHSAIEKLAKYTEKVPYLGKTMKAISAAQEWRRKNLWENTHDALKIVAHNDITTKVLNEAPPGTDVKRTREQIASFLNDSMGGQEWQTKFWSSPTLRKYVSRLMLAPDWTLSVLRSIPLVSDTASLFRGQALSRLTGRGPERVQFEGALGNKLRAKALAVELGVLAVSAASVQYAIHKAFGDNKKGDKELPWDNEMDQRGKIDVTPIMRKMPWHDPKDPTRQYINLGKREGEILRWFSQPTEEFIGKLSTPAAIVYEQISGQEGKFKAQWKQDHESFVESLPSRTVAIGKQALPFAFQGNQFALSVPMSKGMTKYKAQQAYESVFELATNPNRIRSLLRGQQPSEGTISQMTSQITDAAKRNGVPAEEVMKHALSVVRGHHYNEFFKAFDKGDREKIDEEAKALVTLGATGEGIKESVKRRMELQPTAPE